MHPHADVEGITYVLQGSFRHQDSLGNGGLLRRGAVQLMTLGSGALHSEQNGSSSEPMESSHHWRQASAWSTRSLPAGRVTST
jgi:redox-sensitive bicupin YhaK (pirin superfamily)